jgi:hypothetical protein
MFVTKIFNQFNTITMSTKNATAPNPTSLKAAHVRIDELESLLKGVEVNEADILEAPAPAAKKYLATGRVNFPTIGGLALPKNVGFHGYVKTEFEDIADASGQLHAPSREDVTARLQELANEKHPLNAGVELCDISVLPTGW